MALRPPPRAPPYTDYDDFIESMHNQFNLLDEVTGLPRKLPEVAASDWTQDEIQMYFASGGAMAPIEDPKLRAAAKAMSKATGGAIQSPAQLEAKERIKLAAGASPETQSLVFRAASE